MVGRMSEIVTPYFSMFRKNASGSGCDIITTGDPIKTAKGSNITAPEMELLSLAAEQRDVRRHTKDMVEW